MTANKETMGGWSGKPPFPWFGGKSKAAPLVWAALGDVEHYCEPFFGGGAVLLNRPHEANRTYFSETVNDLDGLLVNAWRSIQMSPEETARHCSWPPSELDQSARQLALVRWREECNRALLAGSPEWHDPRMAGWWLWGICIWIGGGWCDGTGAWTADETGRLYKQDKGRGRKDGVKGIKPHLTDNGKGVVAPQLREPGVEGKRPHLNNNGMGVVAPQLREPGVVSKRPHLGGDGRGVVHPGLREPGIEDGELVPHDVTMPKLIRWFKLLSARLRHVRILSGDWSRLVTNGATKTLSVRSGKGKCGIFLDPPYADAANRSDGLYAAESMTVAHDVREWCLKHGDDPDYRIVLAGFDGEHGTAMTAAGWREVEWFKGGFLSGGYGNLAKKNGKSGKSHQQHRERLWLSPHCLPVEAVPVVPDDSEPEAVPVADEDLGLFEGLE